MMFTNIFVDLICSSRAGPFTYTIFRCIFHFCVGFLPHIVSASDIFYLFIYLFVYENEVLVTWFPIWMFRPEKTGFQYTVSCLWAYTSWLFTYSHPDYRTYHILLCIPMYTPVNPSILMYTHVYSSKPLYTHVHPCILL